ncbi:hypothetical protein KM043_003831 [Ampulex compressa]|nr:hypothetical protein KM043_003831 [Ampulex compressa]
MTGGQRRGENPPCECKFSGCLGGWKASCATGRTMRGELAEKKKIISRQVREWEPPIVHGVKRNKLKILPSPADGRAKKDGKRRATPTNARSRRRERGRARVYDIGTKNDHSSKEDAENARSKEEKEEKEGEWREKESSTEAAVREEVGRARSRLTGDTYFRPLERGGRSGRAPGQVVGRQWADPASERAESRSDRKQPRRGPAGWLERLSEGLDEEVARRDKRE